MINIELLTGSYKEKDYVTITITENGQGIFKSFDVQDDGGNALSPEALAWIARMTHSSLSASRAHAHDAYAGEHDDCPVTTPHDHDRLTEQDATAL